MAIITLTADKALRREFIERAITKKMNPMLQFKDLFPVVDLQGATTFKYFEDDISAEDDIKSGVMTEPMEISELSKLTKLEVSPINRKIGDVTQFGYAIDFSKKIQRENGFIDELLRAYERAAYGMARKINLDVFNTIDTYASGQAPTIAKEWSEDDANIPIDIIHGKQKFEDVEGYDYTLTDLFVNTENYREAEIAYRYLPQTFNNGNIEGVQLTNCKQLVQSGTAYAIDMNLKPITIYKNVDTEHSTMDGGIINVNTYTDVEYPFSTHIELYCELGIAAKVNKAMSKWTGL